MKNAASLMWFRNDLRLSDNPALMAAAAEGRSVACVYILENGPHRPLGAASRWWLHHSLAALEKALATRGIPLILRSGLASDIIPDLAQQLGATSVYWNRRYGAEREADSALKETLRAGGVTVESFNAALLYEPWQIKNGQKQPFKVFTPYWKAVRALGDFPRPIQTPPIKAHSIPKQVSTPPLSSLALLPTKPNWAKPFEGRWQPGEDGARIALARFLDEALVGYSEQRDIPGVEGTSKLSPHLAFGEISPRQIIKATLFADSTRNGPVESRDCTKFLAEVGWREFAYHILYQHPDMAARNLTPRFDAMPWHSDDKALTAWKKGQTGYPIVDAGLRQLWQTGWMHNRVRMIVASFLIKHLGMDWRIGEDWFWDTLVDADPASNPFGWQWVAGCGMDAAPYYRIFNPILQGLKFDGSGDYIRTFVPELAEMPAENIHAPWEAPAAVLKRAGVVLGKTYPKPIVDHAAARDRAMTDYKALG